MPDKFKAIQKEAQRIHKEHPWLPMSTATRQAADHLKYKKKKD